MKAFALAVAVAAGVICSAGTADAQYRYRGGSRYYSTPTYSYPVYTYPTYSGTVVTSSYTPVTGSSVVVTNEPTVIGSTVYPASYYSPVGTSYYTYPTYYTPGMTVSPSGVQWNGRRAWRW
jgi:hypothetical protein